MSQSSFLENLDILLEIFKYLPPLSILRLERTCTTLKAFSHCSRNLWWSFWNKTYEKTDYALDTDWRNTFLARLRISLNWHSGKYTEKIVSFPRGISHIKIEGDIAIVGCDCTVVLNWKTGERLHHFKQHTNFVWGVNIKNNILYSASYFFGFRVWDLDGTQIQNYQGCKSNVWCVTPYKDWIVCASENVYVWNSTTKQLLAELEVGGIVSSVCMSDDTIVCGSYSTNVLVWDFPSFNLRHKMSGHRSMIRCVDMSGNIACSASNDKTARVWNLQTGVCLYRLDHLGPILGIKMDREKIVTASLDFSFRIWSVDTGRCLREIGTGHFQPTCLDFSGDHLVAGGKNGDILVLQFGDP